MDLSFRLYILPLGFTLVIHGIFHRVRFCLSFSFFCFLLILLYGTKPVTLLTPFFFRPPFNSGRIKFNSLPEQIRIRRQPIYPNCLCGGLAARTVRSGAEERNFTVLTRPLANLERRCPNRLDCSTLV